MRLQRNHDRRLLVEGKTDLLVVQNLTESDGIDWENPLPRLPFIEDCGGFDGVCRSLPLTLKGSLGVVGVIVDADEHPADRWHTLAARFAANDVAIAPRPDPLGWIGPGLGGMRLGIWLMPDNASRGILEDFLRGLIPADDPILGHAECATDEAVRLGANVRSRSKSVLHAWLAWQENPGRPFGTAIKNRTLRPDRAEAVAFRSWFHRLFNG